MKQGFESFQLPRRCRNQDAMTAAGKPKCPMDPYFMVPEKCHCVDFQTLKLQETPADVPIGELPRHLQLFCERYLTDRVVPGNRITVLGTYSIKSTGKGDSSKAAKTPYIRVIGIEVDHDDIGGLGNPMAVSCVTEEEKQFFHKLASSGRAYDLIVNSIAPSIWGYKVSWLRSVFSIVFSPIVVQKTGY